MITNKGNSNSKRIKWLDALKGTGILLVLFCHAGMIPKIGFCLIAGYMSIFFVAAGYIYKPGKSLTYDMKKRSRRLLLPYFFYGFSSILICYILSMFCDFKYDIYKGLWGLLYSRYSFYGTLDSNDLFLLKEVHNAPLWFATSMFTSLIAFYFLHHSTRKTIIIVLFFIITAISNLLPFLLPWSLDMSLYFSLLIYYGSLKLHEIPQYRIHVSLFLILYLFLLCIDHYNNLSIRIYGKYGVLSIIHSFCIGIGEFIVLSSFFKYFENKTIIKPFIFLGQISLVLMCIHAPIYYIIDVWGGHMFHLAKIIITLIVALIIFCFTKYINNNNLKLILGV